MGKGFSIGNFYFFHYVQKTPKNPIASSILSTYPTAITAFLALLTVHFSNECLPNMTNGQGQPFLNTLGIIFAYKNELGKDKEPMQQLELVYSLLQSVVKCLRLAICA